MLSNLNHLRRYTEHLSRILCSLHVNTLNPISQGATVVLVRRNEPQTRSTDHAVTQANPKRQA